MSMYCIVLYVEQFCICIVLFYMCFYAVLVSMHFYVGCVSLVLLMHLKAEVLPFPAHNLSIKNKSALNYAPSEATCTLYF